MNITQYWKSCNLIMYESQEEYYRALAKEFLACARDCIKDKGYFLAVLGGGKSPARINEEIVKYNREYALNWDKVYLVLSDERYVEGENDLSNYKLIKETLLDKVGGNSLYPIYKADSSVESAVVLYDDYIKKLWKLTGQEYFDYALLGIGNDGHTASLFPNRLPVEIGNRYAVCGGVGPEGLARISLSIEALNRCRIVSFIANSLEKVNILNSMKQNWDVQRYPMQNICGPKNIHILWEE